jgi:ribosomal-protein-alanine acetyltransferase
MEIKKKAFFQTEVLAEALFACAQTSYEHGSPWTVAQFSADIQDEHSEYLVLVTDRVVGFLNYHHFLDEMEIFNLVIDATAKQQGYGSYLMEAFIQEARQQQVTQILLEVRVSNQPARSLYERYEFEEIAQRKNYYHAPVEDAVIMLKKVRIE